MTMKYLVDTFPPGGAAFASWFSRTYQIGEGVFDQAPLDHQVIVLNRFLGYEIELDDSITLMNYQKLAYDRLKMFSQCLENQNDVSNFNQPIFSSMSREQSLKLFNEDGRANPYFPSIKDALMQQMPESSFMYGFSQHQSCTTTVEAEKLKNEIDFLKPLDPDQLPF
jgi:hypothetical protein